MLGRCDIPNVVFQFLKANDQIILLVDDGIHGESLLIRKNPILPPLCLRLLRRTLHRSNRTSHCLWVRIGLSTCLRDVPAAFLTALETVETETFFFLAKNVIFIFGLFLKAALTLSGFNLEGQPLRGRSLRSSPSFRHFFMLNTVFRQTLVNFMTSDTARIKSATSILSSFLQLFIKIIMLQLV